jgi:hypothetical protein
MAIVENLIIKFYRFSEKALLWQPTASNKNLAPLGNATEHRHP